MAVLQPLGIEQLFRVVVPFAAAPQAHASPRPTEDSRLKIPGKNVLCAILSAILAKGRERS